MCNWGDVKEIQAVLSMSGAAYQRIRDIPRPTRAFIRHKLDALKSPLHAVAASGNAAAVQLIRE